MLIKSTGVGSQTRFMIQNQKEERQTVWRNQIDQEKILSELFEGIAAWGMYIY